MIAGACHCGQIRWSFAGMPASATACNCTACRRYGALWAYGEEGGTITLSGPTRVYLTGDRTLGFHFCDSCGCLGWWRALSTGADASRRVAVNLRLADPQAVGAIPVRQFDGLNSFRDLGQDGRTVAQMWF
jgi:hypothetical protein